MGRLKDMEFEDGDHAEEQPEIEERAYPVRLRVDGYDVNHFYDGDMPVYEICTPDGKVLEVAHSTNEMHEMTGSLAETDKT